MYAMRSGLADHPCMKVDCGDAGCILHPDDKKPRCICAGLDEPVPPDEHGNCPDPRPPWVGPTRLPSRFLI